MFKFKQVHEFTKEDKINYAAMCGSILLWIIENRSTAYMAENLNLKPYMVEHNIDGMLYDLRKRVGVKRYIKALFRK